jgi:hypothetical protein
MTVTESKSSRKARAFTGVGTLLTAASSQKRAGMPSRSPGITESWGAYTTETCAKSCASRYRLQLAADHNYWSGHAREEQ